MKKCMELEDRVRTMDREISVNPQYVQKVITSRVIIAICVTLDVVFCWFGAGNGSRLVETCSNYSRSWRTGDLPRRGVTHE